MNYSDELIAKLHETLSTNSDEHITKAYAKNVLSAVIDSIISLAKNGGVSVVGLGSFKYKTYAERQARNPQKGGMLTIPETTRLKFKATRAVATV